MSYNYFFCGTLITIITVMHVLIQEVSNLSCKLLINWLNLTGHPPSPCNKMVGDYRHYYNVVLCLHAGTRSDYPMTGMYKFIYIPRESKIL